jgi:hypothetical protein
LLAKQCLSRQLKPLLAKDEVLAGKSCPLNVAQDLEPANHHVLSHHLALCIADTPLSAA